MLLFCYINLIKFKKIWLSKFFEMSYNLERKEYMPARTDGVWKRREDTYMPTLVAKWVENAALLQLDEYDGKAPEISP